jgi:hypothetical protein
MKGTLTLGDGMEPPEGDLHLSILWQNYATAEDTEAEGVCGENEVIGLRSETGLLEQRLELDTDFPAAFSVELTELPPAAVLMPTPYDPETHYATGKLVVYRDVNGNGKLDRRGFEGSSPDEVLGSGEGTTALRRDQSRQYQIVYLDRDLEEEGFGFSSDLGYGVAGFSLVSEGWDDADQMWHADAQPLDDDVSIELTLAATEFAQRWACSESCQADDEPECPADPAELSIEELTGAQPDVDRVGAFAMEQIEDARTTLINTECLRGSNDANDDKREVFVARRMIQEGCATTYSRCAYDQSELPEGVELPCSVFQENVAFPNSNAPTP